MPKKEKEIGGDDDDDEDFMPKSQPKKKFTVLETGVKKGKKRVCSAQKLRKRPEKQRA